MTTATTATSSPPRPVAPAALRAFGGVWRLTYPRFLAPGNLAAVGGLLAALALLSIPAMRDGRAVGFSNWAVSFYLALLIPVMAFLSGAGALRDEMKPTAVDYVHTRPIRRPMLVVFKFFAHFACAQVVYVAALAVVVGAGVYHGFPGALAALPLMLLAQVLGSAAFMSLGFCFASLTSRYLVLGILYAGIVEAGIGKIPTQLSRLSLTHHLKAMLQTVSSEFTTPLAGAASPAVPAGVLFAVAAALLAISALVFNFREFAGSRPKDA
ncbi:MAG TPA: ABC transporter permease subunit [Opitutaceae bacterium]